MPGRIRDRDRVAADEGAAGSRLEIDHFERRLAGHRRRETGRVVAGAAVGSGEEVDRVAGMERQVTDAKRHRNVVTAEAIHREQHRRAVFDDADVGRMRAALGVDALEQAADVVRPVRRGGEPHIRVAVLHRQVEQVGRLDDGGVEDVAVGGVLDDGRIAREPRAVAPRFGLRVGAGEQIATEARPVDVTGIAVRPGAVGVARDREVVHGVVAAKQVGVLRDRVARDRDVRVRLVAAVGVRILHQDRAAVTVRDRVAADGRVAHLAVEHDSGVVRATDRVAGHLQVVGVDGIDGVGSAVDELVARNRDVVDRVRRTLAWRDDNVIVVVFGEIVAAHRPRTAAAGKELKSGAGARLNAQADVVIPDDVVRNTARAAADRDAGRVVLDDVVVDGHARAAIRVDAGVVSAAAAHRALDGEPVDCHIIDARVDQDRGIDSGPHDDGFGARPAADRIDARLGPQQRQ